MIISDTMKSRLVAKAREILNDYDGEDVWDAVMYEDGKNGYDINLYQEDIDEPLKVIVYGVKDLEADYSDWIDITEEVLA